MKRLTMEDIRKYGPCYDPAKYVTEDFSGTVLDILKMSDVPAKDRLWVAVRADLLTDAQIHAYGLACARMVEANTTDSRVKECNDVVEAFLAGKATREQLSAAESAARSAAESAAWSAAWSARSAAESAAWSARSAARSAAWSAARSAAESAAWSARSAAENRQVQILIGILEAQCEP